MKKNAFGMTLDCLVLIFAFGMAHAQTFETLVNFHGSNGDFPLRLGALIQGTDGSMYGAAEIGGTNGGGTLFRLSPTGGLKTIYNFCSQAPNCSDGTHPYAGLVLGTDGNFYGTTNKNGGTADTGTLFKITPAGALTTLYAFPSESSGYPFDSLVQGSDGAFYGTTLGTVLKINMTGKFTTLHVFRGSDGGDSYASLAQATDGNFYGTTSTGGANTVGTVFRMTLQGSLSTIYEFCGLSDCADGSTPYATLIQGTDGNLYGTTVYGGNSANCANGCGTIFKINLQGVLTTLYTFSETDGANPWSGLLQATDGNLYGFTSSGGDFGLGTIYKVTPGGELSTLHSFDGTDGSGATGRLLQHSSGVFYGATATGGNLNSGTLFSLNTGLGPFVSLVRNPTKVGQQFGILGQGFKGTTSVTLNGQSAGFSVKSNTLIIATVPQGATSGYVTVTTPNGTLTSNVPFRILN
jgi:uncharacterized repeat protein (TIGR03803 family)